MKCLSFRKKVVNLINNLPLSTIRKAIEYLEYLAINSESIVIHKKITNALDGVRVMRDRE